MSHEEVMEKRDHICDIIETLYGVSKEDIFSNVKGCRKRELVQFRRIISVILKRYTKASLDAIGKSIGGKNHATVFHALRKHDERMAKNPKTDKYIYQEYVDKFMSIHLEYLKTEKTEESLHSKRQVILHQIKTLQEELSAIDYKLKLLNEQRLEQIRLSTKKETKHSMFK